jgi:UDP-N-acetylmuramoyl-L-alanyl-D-glutamate--2,6-diaminopimelate ligase
MGAGLRVLTFGIDRTADFRASELEIGAESTAFVLTAGGENSKVRLSLLGRHNVYNALAAITLAAAGGISVRDAVAGAEALRNVPGRLERVSLGQDFTVFVDYAHTDAALRNVLENLKLMPHARIFTIFGCGGDRDRTKRAPMGQVSCALSDRVLVTSDNPRSEDPAQIFADIEAGIKDRFQNYEVIPDRGEAIAKAVALAAQGDILLLAGKGHETYQILNDRTVHFSDMEAAAAAIRKKMEGR